MRAHQKRRAATRAGERRIRLLRIRALLAGGLVLGTGATSTLASWNDAEYANGTFTAARFGIEGSLDGTNYSKHASTGAAALSFSPAVTGLFPGSTSYAAFAVRATTGSVAGHVQVSAGTATGGLSDLRYGVRTVSSMGQCSAAGYAGGGAVIPDGSTLGTSAAGSQTLAADRTPVYYCFALSLPVGASNGMQGLAIAQTWQLVATSG
ncbi:SipW-cognate class signal peptide [Microbacterium azadirachtae]|uniref:SipW-cognate class signal peptide n=1 Tax=Microbacterium azadirachtae TaxID=582680 RepID=A0A1I6GTT0_9MICO|nr:SipW-dependent-type signal peptide-containing protein [Microbacterium azadirachtae]SFR45467.1 SipW-cognate class signal peptide [Microbacterium azadirachtae]